MRDFLIKFVKKFPSLYKFLKKIHGVIFPKPNYKNEIKKIISRETQNRSRIFFVQVGSNDGVHGDPLNQFILENSNWEGIFIEPVKFLFQKLKENYKESSRFIFINNAIAKEKGELDFFYVSENAKEELGKKVPYWYDQLGSFDKSHIIKHLDGILEPFIITEKIKAVPLDEIFSVNKLTEIDILHIDTEGYDFKVLSSFDLNTVAPNIILYEHKHLSSEDFKGAQSLLKKFNYKLHLLGGDTLALKK